MSYFCASHPPSQRCHTLYGIQAWQKAVSDAFFTLDIHSAPSPDFRGALCTATTGRLSISHLRAGPACYQRTTSHLQHCTEESFLITLPLSHTVTFRQLQRHATCHRGHFLLEMSHEPYAFSTTQTSELIVVKVPQEALRPLLRHPERYCAVDFDGRTGIGRLFRQHVLNTARLLHLLDSSDAALLERQLLELFARAVEQDNRILTALPTCHALSAMPRPTCTGMIYARNRWRVPAASRYATCTISFATPAPVSPAGFRPAGYWLHTSSSLTSASSAPSLNLPTAWDSRTPPISPVPTDGTTVKVRATPSRSAPRGPRDNPEHQNGMSYPLIHKEILWNGDKWVSLLAFLRFCKLAAPNPGRRTA